MKKFISTVIVVCSIVGTLSIIPPSAAFAGEVVTTGEGSTYEAALHNAMRAAIEQELGVYVGSKTLTQNQELVKDEVILNSKGFIAGHKVLNQRQYAGMFQLTVQVNVLSEKLRDSLMSALEKDALVEANLNDPRIAVIATDDFGNIYPEIENEIIAALQNQGFSRLFTKADNVDYVVNVRVKTGMEDSVHTANLAVRVVNDIGEVVYSSSYEGMSRMFTDNSEAGAIRSATKRAAMGIAMAALNLAATLEQHVTISASAFALDSCGGLDNFKMRIQSINGVSNVFIRSLKGGVAELDIDYDGNTPELATELRQLGFRVLEIASQFIRL